MTLQEKLDEYRAKFQAQVPKEVLQVMHQATEDLRNSGILAAVRRVGDPAPEFALPNVRGEPVRSGDLLAKGPLVVSFYRGKW